NDDDVAWLREVDGFLDVECIAGPGQHCEGRSDHAHVVLEWLDLVVHGTVTAHGVADLCGIMLPEALDQRSGRPLELGHNLPVQSVFFHSCHVLNPPDENLSTSILQSSASHP